MTERYLEPIKVNYHPTKFGGHRHSGSGDVMVFTFQDHITKSLNDFTVSSFSKYVTILTGLAARSTDVLEI